MLRTVLNGLLKDVLVTVIGCTTINKITASLGCMLQMKVSPLDTSLLKPTRKTENND